MWSYLYLFGKVCEHFCSICAIRRFKVGARGYRTMPEVINEYCLMCVLSSNSIKDWRE